MYIRPLSTAMLLGVLASTALAEDGIPFTYLQFEASVPHFDMAECPAAMAEGAAGFCRVVFNLDAVHVFKFADAGDQPLLAFRSFEEDEYTLSLE